jgi:hypothetical protein
MVERRDIPVEQRYIPMGRRDIPMHFLRGSGRSSGQNREQKRVVVVAVSDTCATVGAQLGPRSREKAERP